MEKFCRDNFSTILEIDGLLLKLLLDNFDANHDLIDDIINNDLETEFKNYIYIQSNIEIKRSSNIGKTPKELFDEAGYILYDECKSEEDIQTFKKYYMEGERLCTFRGERLNKFRIFFAVKKDVDSIKRRDFMEPDRQDKYGTSVLSIQFMKDGTNTLSIKNRYNHSVLNPDSTFSNNLDNIIPGLTNSFEEHYGIVQSYKQDSFKIPGYVKANDNKYYKYNYHIKNVYYCPNNIIIDNLEVKKYEKERYIILDYFILDLKEKTIKLYDDINDSFKDSIESINKVLVTKTEYGKQINITPKTGEIIKIELDNQNRIITYENNNVEHIKDGFLKYNDTLKEFSVKNLILIEDDFLRNNNTIVDFYAPNLEEIGSDFLYYNSSLESFEAQNLQQIGSCFLPNDEELIQFYAPNLKKIGNDFLRYNEKLMYFYAQNIESVGNSFLHWNKTLKSLYLPNLKSIGDYFLYKNEILISLYAPNLVHYKYGFLTHNENIKKRYMLHYLYILKKLLLDNKIKVKKI